MAAPVYDVFKGLYGVRRVEYGRSVKEGSLRDTGDRNLRTFSGRGTTIPAQTVGTRSFKTDQFSCPRKVLLTVST